MMRPENIFDQEKVRFNLARIKKGGSVYEVVVDPDKAVLYKEGAEIDLREVLKAEDVFFDAKKGEHASVERMKEVFGTDDPLRVAKIILKEGEIQLTAEHRARIREEKKKQIINIIARNTCDPKTKLPHPLLRIERAMEEAKVKINEFKKAEDQVNEIIKALRPIIPISVESRKISVRVPSNYAAKLYGVIQGFGTITNEKWLDDGSWSGVVEIPAGLVNEFFDRLNSETHGSVHTEIKE